MINDEPQPLPECRHPGTPLPDVPRTPEGLPFIEEDRTPLDMVFDADGYPIILFEPVPLLRRRKHGWDARRQQAFIAMLCQRVPVRTSG